MRLARARRGARVDGRLRDVRLEAGDVLLLEGDENDLNEAIGSLGFLPLANRELVFEPRRILVPVLLFAAAIAATSFGLVSSSIAFTATVVVLVLVNALRPGEVYEAIDWRSEQHTSELQSLMRISYAVFCLTQKKLL